MGDYESDGQESKTQNELRRARARKRRRFPAAQNGLSFSCCEGLFGQKNVYSDGSRISTRS